MVTTTDTTEIITQPKMDIAARPSVKRWLKHFFYLPATKRFFNVQDQHAIAEAVKTKEIQVLYNPHPEDGISSSVKIGLNASLDADAVLFTVSDQPWLTSETICELIHVFLNTSKGIACVSCQGKMGNPCIFDRKYYNELLSLEGDKGGKKVIMKHLDDTQIYEIEAGRELEDIDYYESIAVH